MIAVGAQTHIAEAAATFAAVIVLQIAYHKTHFLINRLDAATQL